MVHGNALYVRSLMPNGNHYSYGGNMRVTAHYDQHQNVYTLKISYKDSKKKVHYTEAYFNATDFENMLNISKLIWGKEECLG